jgi:hypothetical protein
MSYIGGAYTANPDRREKKPAHLLSNIIEQYDRYKDRFGGEDSDTPNNDYDTLQQEGQPPAETPGQPPVAPAQETPAEPQEQTLIQQGMGEVRVGAFEGEPTSVGGASGDNERLNFYNEEIANAQELIGRLERGETVSQKEQHDFGIDKTGADNIEKIKLLQDRIAYHKREADSMGGIKGKVSFDGWTYDLSKMSDAELREVAGLDNVEGM